MRQTFAKTQLFLMCFAAVAFCARRCPARPNIDIEASAKTVGKYEKLELLIRVDEHYDNPFAPDVVDLSVLIKTPGGKRITLPAFLSGLQAAITKRKWPAPVCRASPATTWTRRCCGLSEWAMQRCGARSSGPW